MKHWVLFALMIGFAGNAALAERTPPRSLPAGEAAEARVIVKFKAAAAMLRAHALGAGDQRATAGVLERRASALGARHGVRLRAGAALGERVQVMHGEPGSDGRALAARLAQDADVEYAEVDRRARRTAVPNDPRFATVSGNGPAVGQWYLKAPAGDVASSIDAVSAWDTTMGSASIIVAVLDTGVRPNHPDLAGKLIGGYDFVTDVAISNDGDGRDDDPSDPGDFVTRADLDRADGLFDGCGIPGSGAGGEDPAPSSWHGTQVSGIIGAATNNGTGMAGAGWDVRVMPVRVLGKCFGNTSDINAAIRWAAGVHIPGVPNNPNPARVINLSLGSRDSCSPDDIDAIAAANAAGSVVVVAAGNTAGLAANAPANCPGAIGVAALRHVGTKVGFSDVGPELAIAAPGGNCVNLTGACLYPILTTIDSGTTTPRLSTYTDSFNASVGTSFSSPLVAATAALMLSVQPSLTPAGVRAALRASARPFPSSGVVGDPAPIVACRAPTATEQLECYCTTATCGAGMLDAGAAVRAAVGIRVVISVSPAAPIAGQAVTLSGDGSTVAPGRSIARWQWSIADAGTTGSTLVDATAPIATLQPAAAGTATVRLVVTDDLGVAVALQQDIAVAAAPEPPPAASGGGGVMSWLWLLALVLATVILAQSGLRRR